MRSKFLLLGLVLVFSGVIITSLFNAKIESYVFQQGYTRTSRFEVSGYFNKGEKLVLSMVPGTAWIDYVDFLQSHAVPDYLDATIRVEINNTEGQRTVVDLVYITYTTSTGETAELMLFQVIENFTSGGLANRAAAGEEGGAFEGVVETNGIYTAKILGTPDDPTVLYDLNIPPTSITLDSYVKQESYPYRETWPIGVVLIASGGFSSFWARRQTKKQKLSRKKKTG